MEFDKTWQEARSQCSLPSLCLMGRSEKQDCRPGLWLAETFWTSPLKPLNGLQRNLTGRKISTSSTKFVFFWADRKNRRAALPIRQKDGTICTQVHDMWPFEPLVNFCCGGYRYFLTHYLLRKFCLLAVPNEPNLQIFMHNASNYQLLV